MIDLVTWRHVICSSAVCSESMDCPLGHDSESTFRYSRKVSHGSFTCPFIPKITCLTRSNATEQVEGDSLRTSIKQTSRVLYTMTIQRYQSSSAHSLGTITCPEDILASHAD